MKPIMATAAKTIQIVKTPGVRGGKARVQGSCICVLDVVYLHKAGLTPEHLRVEYPDLNLAQIHAALSYYYANTEEIEAEIQRDREWEAGFEAARPCISGITPSARGADLETSMKRASP
jgi:uncharacterized protein (DUF433 family)